MSRVMTRQLLGLVGPYTFWEGIQRFKNRLLRKLFVYGLKESL